MQRVVFPKGEQRDFIKSVCKNQSLRQFVRNNSDLFGVSYFMFKQYFSEKITLPLDIYETLCKIGKTSCSSAKVISESWWKSEAGKIGIKSLHKKYNKSIIRKWCILGGKSSSGGGRRTKNITIPKTVNEELAEFIGVCLGDGTMTNYFIRISGDKRYDRHYFIYLQSLVEGLFGFKPDIRTEKGRNLLYLEIRSKTLCEYLHGEFGLPYGDKIENKAKIPHQVFKNVNLTRACLRGLVDTDGSISRRDDYMCLAFTSHNNSLKEQVFKIGSDLKLFTYKYNNQIGTNSLYNIMKFFREVGSSNISHVIRFCERYYNNRFLYKEEVLNYFDKYKNIKLPYKLGSWSSGMTSA